MCTPICGDISQNISVNKQSVVSTGTYTYTYECANACPMPIYAETFYLALPLCLPGSASGGSFTEK